MILNLLTDLTDPNDIPSGYGGLDLNNGGWIVIGILIAICISLLVVVFVLKIYITDYKKTIQELKEELKETATQKPKSENNIQSKHSEE